MYKQSMAAAATGRAPGVVVARVKAQRRAVRLQPALEVLVGQVLVPGQRVGIGEGRLHLRCAVEETQRRLVLLPP